MKSNSFVYLNWYLYAYSAFLIGFGVRDGLTLFCFSLNALAIILSDGKVKK